jgi:hypothetical protein
MTFPGGFELVFLLLLVLGLAALAALAWFVIYTAVRAGNRRR